MKYKVGDEVLVKAQIVEDGVYGYGLRTPDGILFNAKRESVLTILDMTAEEAWKLARRICLDRTDTGFKETELAEIFGDNLTYHIMYENSPQQAKAKIETWEEQKTINVGDVISNPNFGKGVVFGIADDGKYAILTENACSTHGWDRSALKKTGRHIDIAGILKQIRGDE